MEELTLEALYGVQVVIDLCHTCHCLWFDQRESLQLSPHATMQLFRVIHQKQAEVPRPLQEVMACPRCGDRLKLTHDLQRGTRFSYYNCPQGHGRQIPFFQFLKEKNLIKPLDATQLAALRAQVQVVRCSNCGAPVDLNRGAACTHCQAPISGLDPAQVERTLAQLQAHDHKRQNVDPNIAAQLIMDRLKSEGFYRGLEEQDRNGRLISGRKFGVVEAGISAIFDLLT